MEGIIAKIFYNFLIPLFALGVVVFVHELGHFLVARWCGIKVLRFSIGFGPKIFSWKRGETEYCVSWLFFGGYVKFLGDELDDHAPNIEGAYYSVSPFKRILTCLAGPAMNLFFGFLIYCIIFVSGRPALLDEKITVIGNILEHSPAQEAGLKVGDRILKIDGRPVSDWKGVLNGIALSPREQIHLEIERQGQILEYGIHPKMDPEKGLRLIGISRAERVKVGEVEGGSPAEKAGLRKGDLIIGFQNQPVYQWDSLMTRLKENKDKEAVLEVERDGTPLDLRVTPAWNSERDRFWIGFVREFEIAYEHPNPFLAVVHDIKSVFETLFALFARTVSPKGLAGPVGILVMIGAFAKVGWVYFLGLMALISVNLGVFNLLPIPVLDGGHVFFNVIETIRRKALPKKAVLAIQNVFVALLVFFILFVTYQDILRLGSNFFGGKDSQRNELSP